MNPFKLSRSDKKQIAAFVAAAVAAVAAIAILIAAAWPEDSATAKKNFCNSLSNLSSTVMSYQGLDVRTATTDELNQAADDIDNAWQDVVNDANDWANAYDNPLTNAYDDLYYAIQDLPGDYTVAQSLDALEPELSAIPGAYAETFDGSGCSYSS
jgi:inorganic triphosphatase YgiF